MYLEASGWRTKPEVVRSTLLNTFRELARRETLRDRSEESDISEKESREKNREWTEERRATIIEKRSQRAHQRGEREKKK